MSTHWTNTKPRPAKDWTFGVSFINLKVVPQWTKGGEPVVQLMAGARAQVASPAIKFGKKLDLW